VDGPSLHNEEQEPKQTTTSMKNSSNQHGNGESTEVNNHNRNAYMKLIFLIHERMRHTTAPPGHGPPASNTHLHKDDATAGNSSHVQLLTALGRQAHPHLKTQPRHHLWKTVQSTTWHKQATQQTHTYSSETKTDLWKTVQSTTWHKQATQQTHTYSSETTKTDKHRMHRKATSR
jgi:hypothetical protein